MATYNSILKPSVFITIEEVAEWLNIQPAQYAVPPGETAFAPKVRELRSLLERLMNVSCDKIESMIQTCVLAKEFTDILDGNSSNVFVPSKWPILSIEELHIDYNRNFGEETKIALHNAVLRGFADKRQASTDVSLRIVGNDIALRDDGKDSFIGKIFSGSSIGSIKVKYKAGWGLTVDDVPWDLRQAAVLLVEFYYFQRSNRDLNVTSKGIRGESYTKVKDGVPDTICEMVEPYVDIGLPLHMKSQTNTFGI